MERGFGPRALAGLGAAQQQETLERLRGRDQSRAENSARDENSAQTQSSARIPEEDTGRVLDAADSAAGAKRGQGEPPQPQDGSATPE